MDQSDDLHFDRKKADQQRPTAPSPLAAELSKYLPQPEAIRALRLEGLGLQHVDLTHMVPLPSLELLSVARNELRGLPLLSSSQAAVAAGSNRSIVRMRLSERRAQHAPQPGAVARRFPRLHILDLSNNELGATDLTAADSLVTADVVIMSVLDLSGNRELTATAAAALVAGTCVGALFVAPVGSSFGPYDAALQPAAADREGQKLRDAVRHAALWVTAVDGELQTASPVAEQTLRRGVKELRRGLKRGDWCDAQMRCVDHAAGALSILEAHAQQRGKLVAQWRRSTVGDLARAQCSWLDASASAKLTTEGYSIVEAPQALAGSLPVIPDTAPAVIDGVLSARHEMDSALRLRACRMVLQETRWEHWCQHHGPTVGCPEFVLEAIASTKVEMPSEVLQNEVRRYCSAVMPLESTEGSGAGGRRGVKANTMTNMASRNALFARMRPLRAVSTTPLAYAATTVASPGVEDQSPASASRRLGTSPTVPRASTPSLGVRLPPRASTDLGSSEVVDRLPGTEVVDQQPLSEVFHAALPSNPSRAVTRAATPQAGVRRTIATVDADSRLGLVGGDGRARVPAVGNDVHTSNGRHFTVVQVRASHEVVLRAFGATRNANLQRHVVPLLALTFQPQGYWLLDESSTRMSDSSAGQQLSHSVQQQSVPRRVGTPSSSMMRSRPKRPPSRDLHSFLAGRREPSPLGTHHQQALSPDHGTVKPRSVDRGVDEMLPTPTDASVPTEGVVPSSTTPAAAETAPPQSHHRPPRTWSQDEEGRLVSLGADRPGARLQEAEDEWRRAAGGAAPPPGMAYRCAAAALFGMPLDTVVQRMRAPAA